MLQSNHKLWQFNWNIQMDWLRKKQTWVFPCVKDEFASDCKEPQHIIQNILVSTLVKTFCYHIYTFCTRCCLGNAQNVVLCTHLPGVAPGADGFIMSRWGVNFCSNITHSNIQPLDMVKRKMIRCDAIPSTSIHYCLCPLLLCIQTLPRGGMAFWCPWTFQRYAFLFCVVFRKRSIHKY